jgi:hypothetical protein
MFIKFRARILINMSDQISPRETGQDQEHGILLQNALLNMSDEEEATKQSAVPEEEPTKNFSDSENKKFTENENLKSLSPIGLSRNEPSLFECEDGMINKPLSPLISREELQMHQNSPGDNSRQKDLFESEKSSQKELSKVESPKAPIPVEPSREKELTDILVEAAFKTLCADHHQMIVTICTDFSCPKRFWCGICCVKSKDLYVRFSTHMTLISDFLEENISKLYQVKTFSESDKSVVGGKLMEIVSKNQANFEETWKLIERDIEAYKTEVISRIESSKIAVKARFNKSVKTINSFYDQLKDRVRSSKTRDVSLELEALKAHVSSGQKDALEAIESIGNKVNIDIFEVESLNHDFDKTKDFVDFIYDHYPEVRQSTIPNYLSMEKSIPTLADKVENLSMPKIKSVLEDSNRELDSLLVYYESLLTNDVHKDEQEECLLDYLSQREEEINSKALPIPKDVEESIAYRGKGSYGDRKQAATMREPDRMDRKGFIPSNERAVDHAMTILDSKLGLVHQRQSQPGLSPQTSTQGNSKILSIYSSIPASQLMQNELLDLTDRMSTPHATSNNSLFDGCLCPLYNEAEIETIERDGSLMMTTENREFVPVLYLHHNSHLFTSFQKKDTSVNPPQFLYGFKVLLIAEDQRLNEPNKINLVYSSDLEETFISPHKINHITVIERESDNSNLVCINREDGAIYIMSYFVQDDSEFLITLESVITRQTYEGQITSMKRLGNTDFLVCTNSRGEVLTFDTIRSELISAEKSRLKVR